MKIIPNKIKNFFEIRRYEKYQKELNELVNIHHNEPGKAILEVYKIRETLANYAKSKGISIDIYDKTPTDKAAELLGTTKKEENLFVKVTNMLTGKNAQTAVASDTTAVYPKVQERKILLHNPESGTERIATAKSFIQDSFLRNLYRNVQDLTAKVTDNLL